MNKLLSLISCFILLNINSYAESLNTIIDYLAADEIVKEYRSQQIDPIILSLPLYIKTGIINNPEKYLPILVKEFQNGSESDYQTVKLIHDWIVENIAYDIDLFYGIGTGSRSTYEIIKLSRTTCSGFSSLFKK